MITMDTCANPPPSMGSSTAFNAFKDKMSSYRTRFGRSVQQAKQSVSARLKKTSDNNPKAVNALRSIKNFTVSVFRPVGRGICTVARTAAKVHKAVSDKYNAAKHYVETRFPKLAIATKVITQFAINPISYALRGMSVGIIAGVALSAMTGGAAAPAALPIIATCTAIGALVGVLKSTINSAQYILKIEGKENHRILAKAVGLYERAVKPIKDLDAKLEGLHPALSIPYKICKEVPIAAIDTLATWLGGGIGIVAADTYATGGSYFGGLPEHVIEPLVKATFVGGLVAGPAKAAWNIGKFSYERISAHCQSRQLAKAAMEMAEPEVSSLTVNV